MNLLIVFWWERNLKDKKLIFPTPCLICGKPTELCCPYSFCDDCKGTPKAELYRAVVRKDKKKIKELMKKYDLIVSPKET